MRIGIPKEIKNNENRVAMTPGGVDELVRLGHDVCVEAGAGLGSGFSDKDYSAVGGKISMAYECWRCDLVVKVKEPQPEEYRHFRSNLIVFAFMHLAAKPELVTAIQRTGLSAIAYETVQLDDGLLPILAPMSSIAGRIGAMMAAHYLLSSNGGPGILPGGINGADKARFTILGAGHAGQAALRYAVGLEADVTVLDINQARLDTLQARYQSLARTQFSTPDSIWQAVTQADAVISTVLIPGTRAPHVVTADMVKAMKPGRVIVDIAIDQGGSVETMDHATTHADPIYMRHGIIHYAVANIPGAAPRTATVALSNATMPYIRKLAEQGMAACETDKALGRGWVRK